MKEIKLMDSFSHSLHTYIFDDVTQNKGVVQLVHGINEHGKRYHEFAEFLNSQGYVVFIHDHVSQGLSRTLQDGDVVFFGRNGHEVLLDGITTIRDEIDRLYPNNKVYLIGHSLGAMLIRSYFIHFHKDYEKIILNGTGYNEKSVLLGIIIGTFLRLFGSKKPSKFFDNMFRQTQLKLNQFVELDHFIEWLTRDPEKNEQNLNDPYLYIRLSVSAFTDMLKVMQEINDIKKIKKAHYHAPMLLLSGTHDPATNFGEDTIKLQQVLNENRASCQVKLNIEGRHDTLQEINRQEIFTDILMFMEE